MNGWAARSLAAVLVLTAGASAQGIVTNSKSVVFFGSASNTSKPATIKLDDVEKETPEHETIKTEGVRKGSARYELLLAQMHQRITRAVKTAAETAGHDCVVRQGDVKDARGLEVADLTKAVIEQLESDQPPA